MSNAEHRTREARLELVPAIGVGAGDVQHAVRAEVRRIMRETKGDELAQSKLLTEWLRKFELISDTEIEAVNRLAEVGYEAGAGKKSASEAYFESRDVFNTLLTGGQASPVALVLASSAVGSYSITEDPDGSGAVVFKKNTGSWEDRGKRVGAVIGSLWGPAGAAIGGEIGGAVGAAVDECTQD
jgi:hypothetical protein